MFLKPGYLSAQRGLRELSNLVRPGLYHMAVFSVGAEFETLWLAKLPLTADTLCLLHIVFFK